MIVLDVEQRSPEWFFERLGIPSASNFDKIVTASGERSKQRTKYLYQLAGERITEKAEESYMSDAMQKGIELEKEARELYEMVNDLQVKQIGSCFPDELKSCIASPDGLVGEDGLLEIKCPQIHTHVGYLLEGKFPTEYFQQVQGQMYVTGRKWCDFMSYYPGMKSFVIRVNRDEDFIAKLDTEIEEFVIELDQIVEKIQ